MANIATNTVNFFSTTLASGVGASDLTINVATTVGGPASPCYIVIDPETPGNREVVLCDGTFTSTQFATTTLGNRDLDSNGNLTHLAGVTVWIAPLAQMFDDLNDRVDVMLPKAGGTMSGTLTMDDNLVVSPKLRDVSEVLSTVGTSGATQTLNHATANVHDITLTANCTFTFSNPPASGAVGTLTLYLRQNVTGGWTVTWPASVKWPSGAAPALTTTASALDIITFITIDGGTTWQGMVAGRAFA